MKRGGQRRSLSAPNACGASSSGLLDSEDEDEDDVEAGDGGPGGVSSQHKPKPVSGGNIPVSRGKRATSPTDEQTTAKKKMSKKNVEPVALEDENEREEDD